MSHNTSFISNSQEHPAENHINPYNFHDNRPRSALGERGGVEGSHERRVGRNEYSFSSLLGRKNVNDVP